MNDITIRFLEVYEFLLSKKTIKGKSDFAKMIGISTSAMTEILKGRTNAGINPIQNTVNVFPQISSEWLLTGKGDMLLSTIKENVSSINKNPKKEVDTDYTRSLIELIFNSVLFKERLIELVKKEIPKSSADRDLKLINELEDLIKKKSVTN